MALDPAMPRGPLRTLGASGGASAGAGASNAPEAERAETALFAKIKATLDPTAAKPLVRELYHANNGYGNLLLARIIASDAPDEIRKEAAGLLLNRADPTKPYGHLQTGSPLVSTKPADLKDDVELLRKCVEKANSRSGDPSQAMIRDAALHALGGLRLVNDTQKVPTVRDRDDTTGQPIIVNPIATLVELAQKASKGTTPEDRDSLVQTLTVLALNLKHARSEQGLKLNSFIAPLVGIVQDSMQHARQELKSLALGYSRDPQEQLANEDWQKYQKAVEPLHAAVKALTYVNTRESLTEIVKLQRQYGTAQGIMGKVRYLAQTIALGRSAEPVILEMRCALVRAIDQGWDLMSNRTRPEACWGVLTFKDETNPEGQKQVGMRTMLSAFAMSLLDHSEMVRYTARVELFRHGVNAGSKAWPWTALGLAYLGGKWKDPKSWYEFLGMPVAGIGHIVSYPVRSLFWGGKLASPNHAGEAWNDLAKRQRKL